jgi:hypothetical protein
MMYRWVPKIGSEEYEPVQVLHKVSREYWEIHSYLTGPRWIHLKYLRIRPLKKALLKYIPLDSTFIYKGVEYKKKVGLPVGDDLIIDMVRGVRLPANLQVQMT